MTAHPPLGLRLYALPSKHMCILTGGAHGGGGGQREQGLFQAGRRGSIISSSLIYVLPWSEFPIVPSYPHYPHSRF